MSVIRDIGNILYYIKIITVPIRMTHFKIILERKYLTVGEFFL